MKKDEKSYTIDDVKPGTKVLLFDLKECKRKEWYAPIGETFPGDFDIKYKNDKPIGDVVKEMIPYLGLELTIEDIVDGGYALGFILKEDEEKWNFAPELIKEIIS